MTLVDGVILVARRELRAYFDSPIAYITAAVFLVMAGTSFMNSFFLAGVIVVTWGIVYWIYKKAARPEVAFY